MLTLLSPGSRLQSRITWPQGKGQQLRKQKLKEKLMLLIGSVLVGVAVHFASIRLHAFGPASSSVLNFQQACTAIDLKRSAKPQQIVRVLRSNIVGDLDEELAIDANDAPVLGRIERVEH